MFFLFHIHNYAEISKNSSFSGSSDFSLKNNENKKFKMKLKKKSILAFFTLWPCFKCHISSNIDLIYVKIDIPLLMCRIRI